MYLEQSLRPPTASLRSTGLLMTTKSSIEAAYSVWNTLYVDNYLDSFENEAIKRARPIKKMLELGRFNLTKWTCSRREVLAALKTYGLASPMSDLDLDKLQMERTLEVMWDS